MNGNLLVGSSTSLSLWFSFEQKIRQLEYLTPGEKSENYVVQQRVGRKDHLWLYHFAELRYITGLAGNGG